MPIRPFEPPPGDGRGFSDRTAAERPSLPDTHTARWVAGRKRQILRALDEGLITLAEVCRRYELTAEEIAEWRRRSRSGGTASGGTAPPGSR
jgi:transposase-like protein